MGFEGICRELFGFKPHWESRLYDTVHATIQSFKDELVTEKEDGSSIYAFSEEAFKEENEEKQEEEKEVEENRGPWPLDELDYESRHKIICVECAPDPEQCVFFDYKGAKDHKVETRKDEEVNGKHNSFIAAFLPSGFHKKPETVEEVVNREVGDQWI